MARRIALVVAVAGAALVAAGAAPAKRISELRICGAESCTTITDPTALAEFEASAASFRSIEPAAPASYYSIRLTFDAGNGTLAVRTAFYLRSAGAMRQIDRGTAVWTQIPTAERDFLDRTAAGLEPFAVPRVTRATVGGKRAADPASYLDLYRLKARPASPGGRHWKRIRLHSAVPSPWTDRAARLAFSPRTNRLERDGEYLHLPRAVARAVRRAAAVHVRSGTPR